MLYFCVLKCILLIIWGVHLPCFITCTYISLQCQLKTLHIHSVRHPAFLSVLQIITIFLWTLPLYLLSLPFSTPKYVKLGSTALAGKNLRKQQSLWHCPWEKNSMWIWKLWLKREGSVLARKASGREAFSFLLEYIAAVSLALSTLLYEGNKKGNSRRSIIISGITFM